MQPTVLLLITVGENLPMVTGGTFGWTVAGMVAGVIVLWALSALTQLRNAAVHLLGALRPLLLPIVVLAAAGTVRYGDAVVFVVALLVVPAGWIIVGPADWSRLRAFSWWLGGSPRRPRDILGLMLLVVAVAGGLTFAALHGLREGGGGVLSGLVAFGLASAVVSLAARLGGFAVSGPGFWGPRTATAAVIGAGIVLGLERIGVLPWSCLGWVGILAGLAGAVAGYVFFARSLSKKPRPSGAMTADLALGFGGGAALLSGAAMLGATGISMLQIREGGSSLSDEPASASRLYTADDPSIAYRFAPVLAFTKGQRWQPVKVDEYVARSTVRRLDGSIAPPGKWRCPAFGSRDCLQRKCDEPAACARRNTAEHRRGDQVSAGALYVRTLRRTEPRDDEDEASARRALFVDRTETARQTATLLQYWLFYPYDEWTVDVLGGTLIQRHQADWEVVSVGLNGSDDPLFVAYSAHCGGTWRRWREVRKVGTHPIVAVAEGSQANYADTGNRRPPDWTSCTRLPRGLGELFSYALNVRDETDDYWRWGADELVPVSDKPDAPTSFPGHWGAQDQTIFLNEERHATPEGRGPKSPSLQPTWENPFTTIFCDRYWSGPEPCGKRRLPSNSKRR